MTLAATRRKGGGICGGFDTPDTHGPRMRGGGVRGSTSSSRGSVPGLAFGLSWTTIGRDWGPESRQDTQGRVRATDDNSGLSEGGRWRAGVYGILPHLTYTVGAVFRRSSTGPAACTVHAMEQPRRPRGRRMGEVLWYHCAKHCTSTCIPYIRRAQQTQKTGERGARAGRLEGWKANPWRLRGRRGYCCCCWASKPC